MRLRVFIVLYCLLFAAHLSAQKKDTLAIGVKDTAKVKGIGKKDTLKTAAKDTGKIVLLQKKYGLRIVTLDSNLGKGFKMPAYERKFESVAKRTKEMQKVLFALYDQAYLTATFDSVVQDTEMLTAYLAIGQRYEWAYLRKGNVDEGILSQSGYHDKIFAHKPFYYKSALKVMNKILSIYEDHGYPFAQIKLDSVKFFDKGIGAALSVQRKQAEKVDSVVIKGNLKLAPQYFYGYLGIKPGDLYDESKIRVIDARVKALTFISETKPAQVIFVEGKVKIILYLAKRPSDQFNGIIGILPDNTGKITITGDISIALQNIIHHGEDLSIHWQHLQPLTQSLNLHLGYPYLFSTPLGIDGDLNIFKQDTTYFQVDAKLGLKYLLIGGNYVKAFVENIESSLLSTTTLQNLTTGLPPYADVSTELYGLEYKAMDLDYIYNPRSGYELLVNAAVGDKTIHQNSRLNPAIYEGLQLNSTEYRANINAAYYIPFFTRSAFKLALNGGYINAPSLMLNDLYRIGGFAVLRGFDEQSIYASQYAVGTIEFHYLLEQNSFFFLFFDQGWYRELTDIDNVEDTPYGFGVGMDFQTKAGIFSLSYALGKQFSNPISFNAGKINFGIVNNF